VLVRGVASTRGHPAHTLLRLSHCAISAAKLQNPLASRLEEAEIAPTLSQNCPHGFAQLKKDLGAGAPGPFSLGGPHGQAWVRSLCERDRTSTVACC
jgi:hypothetical protein